MSDHARQMNLQKLVEAAEPGGYTLPDNIAAAWRHYEQVKALPLAPAAVIHPSEAAEEVVAAVAAGKPVDLLEVARASLNAQTADTAYQTALRIHSAAIEQAGHRAVATMTVSVNEFIAQSLQPAHAALLDDVRATGDALDGYGLDVHRLLSAPDKARKAYAALPTLVARWRLLWDARRAAMFVAGVAPQHDTHHYFAEFRKPQLINNHRGSERWPGVPAPDGEYERLLWAASPAVAKAQPWIPTADEQDAAWHDYFGEGVEMRARAGRDAIAIGARM